MWAPALPLLAGALALYAWLLRLLGGDLRGLLGDSPGHKETITYWDPDAWSRNQKLNFWCWFVIFCPVCLLLIGQEPKGRDVTETRWLTPEEVEARRRRETLLRLAALYDRAASLTGDCVEIAEKKFALSESATRDLRPPRLTLLG